MKMHPRYKELRKHGDIAREHVAVFHLRRRKSRPGRGTWHEPNAHIQHAATLNATQTCAAKRNTSARWGQPQVAFATAGGDGAARPQYNRKTQ